MNTESMLRRNRTSFPPCYDYRFFQSLGQFIINDEMAKLMSSELKKSGDTHPLLVSLCKDLDGVEDNPFWPESANSYDPCYDWSYFRGRGTCTLNKSAARIVSEALNKSNNTQRIHSALWSLNTELYRFFKHPSSAISQAAYSSYKFANVKGNVVEIPLEQYQMLCNLFERKEFNPDEEPSELEGVA